MEGYQEAGQTNPLFQHQKHGEPVGGSIWGGGEIIRLAEEGEIREAFDRGWRVDSIREARFETNLGPEGCRAWLSSITRE